MSISITIQEDDPRKAALKMRRLSDLLDPGLSAPKGSASEAAKEQEPAKAPKKRGRPSKTADAKPVILEAKAGEPAEVVAEYTIGQPSREDVRAALVALKEKHGIESVREILSGFVDGPPSTKSLEEKDFGKVLEACAEYGQPADGSADDEDEL